MNNDPTPSLAANRDLPSTNPTDTSPPIAEPPTAQPDSLQPASSSTQQNEQSPAQKRAHAQTKKKYEFVNGLMTNLDVLIYAELCIVYYMDCSLFRLLFRVLSQMMFLTPKPNFVPPMPQHRPYIGAIFGPNIICMFLHILTARSEAGESMRGYLHGGVIIDLIGQKGPTSKFHLVLLDILLLGLQCFMLAVHVERERLAAVMAALVSPATTTATATEAQPRAEIVEAQDHDAEERGVFGTGAMNNGDIELQPMVSTSEANSGNNEGTLERDEERERLLAEPHPRQDPEDDDATGVDAFWSGTAIVADFHIVHTLRKQWEDYGNALASALQTVGFSAEFAAVAGSRRINAASARFQRNMEALGA
ncbi:Defective for SREBP cleavage 4 [Hyphodiscus hymeniophilus]|uniref:Defective for SREBP cleavage 4 n=1 Tax=Hyphodiscus hymeniophilus TaxID=353542 RepID=A0A9P7AYY3_9HELO|nr:Defective for SREBP cleavage 4 [Hyphodiscus hymeniophilus]